MPGARLAGAPMVAVRELVTAAAVELSADGVPVDPVAVVDLSSVAPAEALDTGCAAASASARVLIGVSDGAPHASWTPLMRELTATLVAGADDRVLPVTCVAVDDVDAAVGVLVERAGASPRASATLVQLLRLTSTAAVPDALVAESLAYSTLLAGPEFAAWRRSRPVRRVPEPPAPVVLVDRSDGELTITLNHPERHNAYGWRIRDALTEALSLARWDASVTGVVLSGAGPSFCSGGDLDEFGTTPDVATAHVVRTQRSAAAALHALTDRVEAHVHGACIGAGVELPAFCGLVVARDDAFFELPEIAMGLVPGAGGTVSVCRRIGRWRTGYLALSGRRIGVDTAIEWRLVDRRADS